MNIELHTVACGDLDPRTLRLSIVICTVRLERCVELVRTLAPYALDEEIIVILDGLGAGGVSALRNAIAQRGKIEIIASSTNQGLSVCRNLGMTVASNRHILFLDDDVQLIDNLVEGYRRRFLEGYHVVGGPLMLPASYPPLPWWLPRGLSYLMGVHTTECKIWGGNFGFVRIGGGASELCFRAELGRKGRGLQSGDDTTFVKELLAVPNLRQCFAPELAVEHRFELTRYRPSYVIRRAFWQGRSEVRRRSFGPALKKQAARTATLGHFGLTGLVRLAVGAGLFSCFLVGMLYEVVGKVARSACGSMLIVHETRPSSKSFPKSNSEAKSAA